MGSQLQIETVISLFHYTTLTIFNINLFSRVIDGGETLDDLEKIPVNEKTYKPLRDVHIQKIKIHANPIADMQS